MPPQKTFDFSASFICVLALLIAVSAFIPRFLGVGPALIGLIFSVVAYRSDPVSFSIPKSALILTLPILLLGATSALWAIAPGEVLERTGKLAAIMLPSLLLIAGTAQIETEKVKLFLPLLAIAIILAALATGFETLFDDPFYRLLRGLSEDDAVSDAVHNRGAVALTLCAFPVAGALYYSKRFRYLGALIGAVFFMMVMIESQSAQQAAMIGAAFALFFPYRCRLSWYAVAGLIGLGVLTAPFMAVWAFPNLADRLSDISFFHDGYAAARLEIWDFVSRYALDSPFYGYGLEASRVIEDFDSAKIYHNGTSVLHPHNFAIQLWLEFGVIGAFAGSAFVIGLLYLCMTKLSPDQGRLALPVLMTSLSVAATGYGMWQSWWIGLLFLLAALTLVTLKTVPAESAAR